MAAGPLVSIIVPTRNEREAAPLLVDRLRAALPGVALEICVVDDSDDDTPAVLAAVAARHPGLLRVRHRQGQDRRGGLSTAVVEGLRLATGRYVCVMDADLQHPPETVAAMLAAAERGADLVVASRYTPGGSVAGLDGRVRRVVSRGATALARLLFSEARRSHDPLSGFFLCRRALIDGVEFRPVGFKILLELLVLLPGVGVTDVPLRFGPRAAGQSKASVGQGVQYLRHLRSLVLEVQGSARLWKFGLVGLSGLAVFVPVLALGAGPLGLPALLAFLPAWLLSIAWNTALNRRWTFADIRREHRAVRRGYLSSALLAGGLMFGVYALLVAAGLRAVVAGAVSTLVAGVANGLANRPAVRRPPDAWSRVVADRGLQAGLEQVADRLGADRAYVVPARRRADGGGLLAGLVAGAVEGRRALLLTEAPSYRPQRRTNIASLSLIAVPVVRDDEAVAVVVCERRAPRGFDDSDLEAAAAAVLGLGAALAGREDASTAPLPGPLPVPAGPDPAPATGVDGA